MLLNKYSKLNEDLIRTKEKMEDKESYIETIETQNKP